MIAHRIDDLVSSGPFGRTTVYKLIAAGTLPARKIGRATIVLDADWRALLENAPKFSPKDVCAKKRAFPCE